MHADHCRELAVIPVCYGRGRTAAAQRAHKQRTGSAHDRRREESKKRNPSCIRRCSGGAGFPFGEGKAGRRRCAPRSAAPATGEGPAPEPAYRTATKRGLTGQRLAWFNRVWDAFGYKRNKAEAADAFIDIEGLSESLVAAICRAAEQEAARRPDLVARGKTPKMLTGWLSGRRWEDEADAPPPLVPVAARGPLLGAPVIDVPTQAQREEGWKAGLSFMEKWRHGVRPDNQVGQFDRRKPLPIPANFRSVLQRAL